MAGRFPCENQGEILGAKTGEYREENPFAARAAVVIRIINRF
jgi:hypothetical protein